MNFSHKQKLDNNIISTAKCEMVGITLGCYNKTSPKTILDKYRNQWHCQTFVVARAIRSHHQGSFKLHNFHIMLMNLIL